VRARRACGCWREEAVRGRPGSFGVFVALDAGRQDPCSECPPIFDLLETVPLPGKQVRRRMLIDDRKPPPRRERRTIVKLAR